MATLCEKCFHGDLCLHRGIMGKEDEKTLICCGNFIATADVVPKSEVEKIFEEIESKKIFLADKTGKIGVVVKIKDIAELEKKYTEKLK